jgi:hypothetical protein
VDDTRSAFQCLVDELCRVPFEEQRTFELAGQPAGELD